jgi:DNA ligase-1
MTLRLEGKTVCVTGALSTMTRAQAHQQLEALGAIVSTSVTKKTDILFCGERAGMKLEKAESLGIPIYHEKDFNKLVGDDAAVARAAERMAETKPSSNVLQEIEDGQTVLVQGSAAKRYELKNTGGVYSCTCPAWRNQSAPIDLRSCKHLAKIRGAEAETERVGRKVATVRASSTSKPKVLLAQSWEPHIDPSGYWMSEKLDGVRAIWTGEHFISRQGNPFYAPDWFVDGFPDHPLDGELWIDRGQFQKTVSVVRRQDKSQHWKDVRYVIFDAPDHEGTFEERMGFMKEGFAASLEYASVLEHALCEGVEHLRAELERIEGLGGEGLMLREARSKYVGSRSTTLLKVKTFHDAEAKVVGYKGGQGKHRNRVGALELITPEGITFFVGTGLSDRERENPPELGALVTYRFQELTDAGVPRFPSFVGVRIDGEDFVPKAPASKPAAKKKSRATKASSASGGTGGGSAGGARRFVYGDEVTGKFWEIAQEGANHTVRYGKCTSTGALKTKEFSDEGAARKDVERLIRQKTGKGYVEVEGGAIASAPPTPAPQPDVERPTRAAKKNETKTEKTTMNLKGKTVCVTGKMAIKRKEAEAQLTALGATVKGSVTKDTEILFVGEDAGSKLDKAQSMGIDIVDEAGLMKIIG